MRDVEEERVRSAGVAARIQLTVGSVPPLPFGDAAFDAVFMAFTLELFPDDTIPIVLCEVHRVLRSPGRIAGVSMAHSTQAQRHGLAERIYVWMHCHFPRIVDCRPSDVERALSDGGFTLLRTERLQISGLPIVANLAYHTLAHHP
jgi:demethylmenaquinone methyltransferase/2-methoxy-6-polyprenyl-1,4-benzoquinol methylase